MLAARSLDIEAQPQQMDNAVKSVTFKNNSTTLARKSKGGSDFKDILAPKLKEKAKSKLDSLSSRIKEYLDNKDLTKLKPGEAAKMVEALLKVLRGKKVAAGEALPSAGNALPSADRTNLLNLLKRLEEFIKEGLKQEFPGEKDNFKRLKKLKQEIFSLITDNGGGQAGSAAAEKSQEIILPLSAGDADPKEEKPVRFTLVDLRKDKVVKQPAAIDPVNYTGQKKAGALVELVSESSRQSMPAELKAENNQILVRTFSFETGESKGGIEAGSTLSSTFRRLLTLEIVQQSRLILQDGGKGEIRLILKPESLGRVIIRINIRDNSIEGRILVENNSVRELFEGNLEHLRNALRSEGFGAAALEVAVSGEKSGRDPVKEEFPFMSKEGASDEFERSMLLLADFGEEDLLIDLVV